MKHTLEVIAVNNEDCLLIEEFKNYIETIEYCVDLKSGGLTPQYSDLEKLLTLNLSIPIHLMLRTSSNDHLNDIEIRNLRDLLLKFKKLSCVKGFVFGILKNTSNHPIINLPYVAEFCDLIMPKTSVFHRAFDEISSITKIEVLHQLKKVGISTVLMTGSNKNIVDNAAELISYQKTNTCKILCGGGINFENIHVLVAAGLKKFHIGSCIRVNNSFNQPIDRNLLIRFIEILQK